ncbi:MAG: phospholipase D-like domain-containing protein, partial [Pseudonocardia sp.]|nr:phospholipase D-like domain-containing protein [Pseudonocardia sp.]
MTGPHADRPVIQRQSDRHRQHLLDAGVEVWCYQPTLMHAKVVTVDEQVGVVGTVNLDLRSFTLNEQVGRRVARAGLAVGGPPGARGRGAWPGPAPP